MFAGTAFHYLSALTITAPNDFSTIGICTNLEIGMQ